MGLKGMLKNFYVNLNQAKENLEVLFWGNIFLFQKNIFFNLWLFNIENQKKLISFYRFFNINKCLSIYIIKKIRSIANHNTFFSTTLTLSILLPIRYFEYFNISLLRIFPDTIGLVSIPFLLNKLTILFLIFFFKMITNAK